jgi:hypothetical protein
MPRHFDFSNNWSEPLATVDDEMDPVPFHRTPAERSLDVERRIRERLGARIRDLKVSCDGDTITLRGKCQTYHSKQLAQHAAQGVLEDEVLRNGIEVEVG